MVGFCHIGGSRNCAACRVFEPLRLRLKIGVAIDCVSAVPFFPSLSPGGPQGSCDLVYTVPASLRQDNMRRRQWPENLVCSFKNQIETFSHLFFTCYVARVVCVLRNLFGTSSCPKTLWQDICRFYCLLPGGKKKTY
jgi:hypothetical protein